MAVFVTVATFSPTAAPTLLLPPATRDVPMPFAVEVAWAVAFTRTAPLVAVRTTLGSIAARLFHCTQLMPMAAAAPNPLGAMLL